GPGEGQVDQVAVEQVDLRRAARALAQHDVEAVPQPRQRVEHHRQQGRLCRGGVGVAETAARASRTPGTSACFAVWYSAADSTPVGRPRTTTWLDRSLVGLSRIGFMA